MKKHRTRSGSSGELHELGLAAAARAIRNGDVSSEAYVGKLLERARAHADLKAFITIDEASVLQAARQADRSLRAGRSAPLLGVPLAVKDSWKSPVQRSNETANLKGVKFAYAPRQHLVDVDGQTDSVFREALRKLKDAGAELVEVDLGGDFLALTARTTWPIFFHETMPAVREFLAANEVPVSFEQIYAGLGEHIKASWSRAVVPSGAGYVSDEKYLTALNADRRELRRRFASIAFGQADALLFPTTPCVAPRIENQWMFQVGGKDVTEIFLSRNTHPSSSAGVPGISLPMALNSEGLPLGLELDAASGRDRDLLALARRVEQVIGRVPRPPEEMHAALDINMPNYASARHSTGSYFRHDGSYLHDNSGVANQRFAPIMIHVAAVTVDRE